MNTELESLLKEAFPDALLEHKIVSCIDCFFLLPFLNPVLTGPLNGKRKVSFLCAFCAFAVKYKNLGYTASAIALPSSTVVAVPPISGVRNEVFSSTVSMACSTAAAAA
jgi:hypothetical protein